VNKYSIRYKIREKRAENIYSLEKSTDNIVKKFEKCMCNIEKGKWKI